MSAGFWEVRKKMTRTVAKFALALGLLLAASVHLAFGQSGSISGTVQDSSGAIIPNATVKAQNLATDVIATSTTNQSGFYLMQLPAGSYRVEATAAGFQSLVHDKITVDALASVALNISLTVGATTTEVEVNATTDTIQTDNPTLGSTLRNEVYAALPLQLNQGVPRDPTTFITLAPGVATDVLQSAGPSYTSFNGGQQEVNGLYFEGLPISFPNQMGDTRPISLGVSVDAVNQFQVEINGEKAEYQGQGFHNYVLKSGSSQFHGNLFEYLRNTALDAKNYFFTFVPTDHQNEYGGNIGGPIKRDKIFFFANYDAYDFNTTSAPTVLTIPDALERAGNFGELTSASTTSNPLQLYDPTSQSCVGTVCTKLAYTTSGNPDIGLAAQAADPLYNVIPATELSTASKSLESYLPATNVPNPGAPYVNNYSKPLNRAIWNKNVTTRVDYNISQKDRLYGVFAYGTWETDYTGNLTPTGTALPLPYTASPGIVVERPVIAQLHETRTLSSSLVNDIGVGLVRLSIPIYPITQKGKYPEAAGLAGLPGSGEAANGFPAVNFSGSNVPSNWGSTGPFLEWENDVMGQDALTWVHGKHAFKFGITYQSTQDNRASPADGTSASFSFSSNETAGFNSAGALVGGNAFASYMLGAVDSAAITDNSLVTTGSRFHNYSLFAQDDWKVNNALNVNLGLRWDVYAPFGEEHNRFSSMVPTLANPVANNIPGALVYGKGLVPTHYKNFQPRVGLEYQFNKNTVLRAGFVMADTLGALGIGGNGPNGPGQLGFNPPTGLQSTVTGQPSFFWASGVSTPISPAPQQTAGFGAGNSTVNPNGAIAPDVLSNPSTAGRSPEYINYSFGVQRELPGQITLSVTYSASGGRFLSRYSAVGPYNNSMNPQYLALGSLLNAQATPANVTAAQAMFPNVGLPFPNFKGTIANMLLPFPQYAAPINTGAGSGGIVCYSCDEGSSSYNSMQVYVQRHLSRGLTAQFAYTLAKEIDDINGTSSQVGAVTGGTRNPYDHTLDRGMGDIDHRHNIHLTWVYDLPAGKGHMVSGGAIGDTILGHWQWSGIWSWETGFPLGVTGTKCSTPGIVSTCLVNLTPGFSGGALLSKIGSGNAHKGVYLNVGAFQDPAPFTFGNEPRDAPYGLRVPTNWEVDSTLRRTFPIHDQINFQFSADFFNLINNVIFAAPATNIDASTFGTVTTTQNSPRRIQFSGRFSF
jgi:hypothetical protein